MRKITKKKLHREYLKIQRLVDKFKKDPSKAQVRQIEHQSNKYNYLCEEFLRQ